MGKSNAKQDLDRIVESARRLGVELDEMEALQWLTAVALAEESRDVTIDMEAGVFGHQVTMLDFSDADLDHFRAIGEIVELHDRDDVETALALSGSAAQSKVQTHPGDCDYFERVNIKADTRELACARLAEILRDKAMADRTGDTYQLVEAKFGNYPVDVVRDGREHRRGTPISWTPDEVAAGRLAATTADGDPVEVTWEQAACDPGWCKLDWVVADPVRRQVSKASNVLDVTWEAPDGTLTPLDGYLDPYFQEVYLEADSIPLFTKVVDSLSSDALAGYLAALEQEVHKYAVGDRPNYGKAAKRMYNIFRLNGSYEEAAYLRELFDEPTAVLYQVGAVVETLEEAAGFRSAMDGRMLLSQLDELVMAVVRTLDGDAEVTIVADLLQLRAALTDRLLDDAGDRDPVTAAIARAHLADIVNGYFHDKLTGLPAIASYLDDVTAPA